MRDYVAISLAYPDPLARAGPYRLQYKRTCRIDRFSMRMQLINTNLGVTA